MSKRATKTDNSHLQAKVKLRIESLPRKKKIHVLECFAGNGVIWREVQRHTSAEIKVLKIDIKQDRAGVYLKGDNIKFLKTIDLSSFDVIDLDAYGSPFKQIEVIFDRGFSGVVHCTFIQSVFGALDKKLLLDLGYSEEMIKKSPTLFYHNGQEKLFSWLALRGVSRVRLIRPEPKKSYFYFILGAS